MSKQKQLTIWVALTSCFITGLAQAATLANEIEPNDSPSSAQTLITSGGATVNGAVGNGPASPDQDWYTFYATAGDVVTIDIDGTTNGLDTVVGLYFSDGSLVDSNDDMLASLDPGSSNVYDSMIANKALADTGFYTVVVCASPCGPNGNFTVGSPGSSTGNYQLLITGASGSGSTGGSSGSSGGSGTNSGGGGGASGPAAPADVMQVATQARPGKRELDRSPINPRSHGMLPVIIYSGPHFNPLTIDTGSLTFGSSGDEHSFKKCNYQGRDHNHDGKVDLLCLFSIQKANLDPTSAHAKLKGETKDGTPFESNVFLKYLPDKR